MKKLIIILGSLGVSSASIIAPTAYVVGQFTKSLNKNQSSDETETNEKLEGDISDSNQGFLDIKTLNLSTNLGEVESPSAEFIIQELKRLNKVLENSNVYVKGISLTQAKFTVENYTGTMDAFYEITDLGKLVPNKNLGKIINIRENTIVNRIKEINRNLANTDFSSDIVLKVISLNEISMDWKDAPENSTSKIILTYEVTSLEGIFLNNDLGETSDLSENWISKTLFELNPQAEFLNNSTYKIKLIDLDSQTPEFAIVALFNNNNEVRFDAGSQIAVNYNTKNIAAMILNTELGEINKLDQTTILQRVNSLNPIFANFRNNHETTVNYGLTSATVTNLSLSNQVVVNYRISNVSGIFESTNIGEITNFVNNRVEQTKILISGIKSKNTLLRSIDDLHFQISSINIKSFSTNDSVITNNTFVLKILNFNGEVQLNFNIRRESISTLFTTTQLGTFYWVKKEEIIQRIKERNGVGFNDTEINYSNPTYTSIQLTAKEDSLSYYGFVTVTYTTNFKKISDFDFRELKESTSTAEQVNSNQYLKSGDKGGKLSNASYDLKYAIPNGINAALAEGKKEYRVAINTAPSRITTFQSMNDAFLRKYDVNSTLSIDLRKIGTSPSAESTFVTHSSMPIKFRNISWFSCSDNGKTYNLGTKFSYSYWLSTENGESIINFRVLINSTLDDWSNCDDLNVIYRSTIKSVELI